MRTYEIHQFFGDKYAILSHTWGEEEVISHSLTKIFPKTAKILTKETPERE